MKIVYISSSIIPSRFANSIHVMKMCQAFAHNGHEVVLLAPDIEEKSEQTIENVYNYYNVKKNFEIEKVPALSFGNRMYGYGGLAAYAALKHKPDIVFGRHLLGCYFSSWFDHKVIFESHQPIIDSHPINQVVFKKIIKKKNLYKLVVLTHALKNYYQLNFSISDNKIQVEPDAADPLPENIEPIELPNKGLRMQVGYVGHLYPGKGMEVISKLAFICPWADFHIVGGTDKDLRYWRNKQNSSDNLIFHGHVDHLKAQKYIKSFDVVLLPNQKHVSGYGYSSTKADIGKWTSPLKVFEYMAAQKPIISSDIPILKEVLKHGENAFICSPDNPNEWKKALEHLRDHKELRQSLAEQAYQDFIKLYTWTIRANKLIE